MAERDIGRVFIDVESNEKLLRAKIAAAIEKPFDLKLQISKREIAGIRGQINAALARPFTVRIEVDRKGIATVVKQAEATQKAITATEQRGEQQRQTNRERFFQQANLIEKRKEAAATKTEDSLTVIAKRGEDQRSRDKQRIQASELARADRHAKALELIQKRLDARITGVSLTNFQQSITRFSSVTTRALRVSALAFTAWGAAVTAAVGGAAAFAIAEFARVDLAARRAGAVFASDAFQKNIEQGSSSLFDFASAAEASSRRVIEASNAVAKTTIFNPTQVAEGAKALAQAGLSEADALRELATVARFAQNEELDMFEATRLLTSGLFAAGRPVAELTALTDKFTIAAQATSSEADEIAEAFSNRAAGAFKAFGQTVEETILGVELFAQAGIRGRTAGEQLGILIRFINQAAGKNADAFEKYGIAIQNADGSSRKFSDVLIDLQKLWDSLASGTGGATEAQSVFRDELGLVERSMSGFRQILPQIRLQGRAGLDEQTRLLQTSAGTTERVASVITESLKVQFQAMIENILTAFQSFGVGANESLKGVFDTVNNLVNGSTPAIEKWGRAFGRTLDRLERFLQTEEFKTGIQNLVEAIRVTLRGVGEAFRAFSGAESGASAFVGFTEAVLAFSRASAEFLPAAARIIGEIVRFLTDNAEAFKVFALTAVGITALNKAFTLLVKPLLSVSRLLSRAGTRMGLFAGTTNVAAKSLLRIAGPIGVVIAGIDFLIGSVQGFNEEMDKQLNNNEDLRESLKVIGPDLKVVAEAFVLVAESVREAGVEFGRLAAGGLVGVVNTLAALKQLNAAEDIDDVASALGRLGQGLEGVGTSTLNLTLPNTTASLDLFKESAAQSLDVVKDLSKPTFEAAEAIARVAIEASNAAASYDSMSAAQLANNAFTRATKDTQGLIDLYRKAAGDGANAERIRKLLGVTQSEASIALVSKLKEQLDNLQQETLGPFADRLGEATTISPKLNETALTTINAALLNLTRQRREIAVDASIPKGVRTQLLGQIDAEIKALRGFVSRNPVRIEVGLGGVGLGGVRAPFDPAAAIGINRDAVREAIRNPALINELTDAQRQVYDQVRERVAPFASAFLPIDPANVREALAQVDQLKSSVTRSAPGQVRNTFAQYARDAATGLAQGVEAAKPVARVKSQELATAFFVPFAEFYEFGSPSRMMRRRGVDVVTGFVQGVASRSMAAFNAGQSLIINLSTGIQLANSGILAPALRQTRSLITAHLNQAPPEAFAVGFQVMESFLQGMKARFGDKGAKKGTIAHFLHIEIPALIRELKGPVAYDATILVPAGEAIMHGLDRGLRSGFGGVESFLRDVGPSMEEFVPESMFAERTKKFMVDVAMGKNPDVDKFFGDLVPEQLAGFTGALDPTLAFLHRTLSLADTQDMAGHLAKLFGLEVTSTDRAAGTLTSSNKISDHTFGTAADISGSVSNTDRLAAALKPLYGKIFKQLIWHNEDLNRGFFVPDHEDHLHAAWLMGAGFDKYSGKKGKPAFVDIPGASNTVDRAINEASRKHNVELALLAAIAKQESRFSTTAGSPAGAQGLFQFMPGTAAGFGINPWDPFQAAEGGARYIKNLMRMFGGRIDLALAGYNAGPGAVQRYGGIPPYSETRNYVRLVMSYLEDFRKLFGGAREHGGPVNPRQMFLVGERGPELFMPRSSGNIVPAGPTASMMGSMGAGRTVNHNPTYNITTNATDPRAVAAYVDAHSRNQIGPVNLR